MADDTEIKQWIIRVIESCKHTEHLVYAEVLVKLFIERSENNDSDITDVQLALNAKYNLIHNVIN